MTVALLALVAAHAFDYFSFIVMTAKHGMAAEANPVVVHLAEAFGLPGLTIAKLGSVAFLAGVAILAAPQRPKVAGMLVAIGITAGMVGGISNVASI
jgi:hypothetical protein